MKVFKVADIKKLEGQVARGEISYSKMVYLMNQQVQTYFRTLVKLKQ